MTLFIIPTLFLFVFVIWVRQFRTVSQGSAVLGYKLLYRWRCFLSALQPTGIDQLDNGVIILDKFYRVMDMNVVGERLLNKTAVSLIGLPITTIWPDLTGKMKQADTGKLEIVLENLASARTYEICWKPIPHSQKQPNHHILIFSDLTEQKNLERMRRDMTHTLVHDLRAPLSNSMFALQMLEAHLNGHTTPEAVRMVGMTINNTEKILERVNKILDVERLESNQMPLALSAVSLPGTIDTVLEAQASRIAEKRLDIIYYVPDSLAHVWVDASLLERIIQNLIDNSIKFTPVGGEIVIEATAVPLSHPPAVHISIFDTGTGIPQPLQETIFNKFSGASETGSSGLGLAFCKMALAAHGQDIWVESEPGRGSVFTFSLLLAAHSQRTVSSQLPV